MKNCGKAGRGLADEVQEYLELNEGEEWMAGTFTPEQTHLLLAAAAACDVTLEKGKEV